MIEQTVSYPAAFIAGLLSFLSPCILPLIPAYFSFITGMSIEELIYGDPSRTRGRVVTSTLSYVSGFSTVFILLGASASFLGGLISSYSAYIRIAGGVAIIILGIHMTGIVRIRALEFEKRLDVKEKPLHFFGTFLVGMAFGAGWTPCVGPLLGSILIIAGSQETVWQGVALLSVYSAGLAIPFIVLSVFINFMLAFMRKASRIIRYVNMAAGALLIAIGISLVANRLYI